MSKKNIYFGGVIIIVFIVVIAVIFIHKSLKNDSDDNNKMTLEPNVIDDNEDGITLGIDNDEDDMIQEIDINDITDIIHDADSNDNDQVTQIPKTEVIPKDYEFWADQNIVIEQKDVKLYISNGYMRIEYDIASGEADIYERDSKTPTFISVHADVVLENGSNVKSSELVRKDEFITIEELDDGFGKGVKLTINNTDGFVSILQNYYLYHDVGYILMEAVITSKQGVKTNNIAPISAGNGDLKGNVFSIDGEDIRFLFVPFDNDAFVRYESLPIIRARESYEVTTIFDNASRHGLVIGSVTHDTWKTGIKVSYGSTAVNGLRVFGGITSGYTRDALPHGYVSGNEVCSPKIFLGFYEDYRDGMEEYGEANTVISPPLAWDKGCPVGWNSWSAVATEISYDIYTDASDFIKEYLQENSFSQDGVVYINFDSFWDNLTETQLKQAAQYVIDNGHIPGIYTTPFVSWGDFVNYNIIPRTEGKYRWNDIVLKDFEGNELPLLDGGKSTDPTHPGSVMQIANQLKWFYEMGFRYVKLDFLSHGAREGDFYNKEITTGIQAYNYGMQKIIEALEDEIKNQEFFISFSIAPIFPSQYGHSRRISCDVFGSIDNTEYMLNSLSYGWWMNNTIYRFTDPDHIVLYNSFNNSKPTMMNEALSRYISAAIAGTIMLNSDDYRNENAAKRIKQILTNEEINAVAKKGVAFRPVEGNTDNRACDTFVKYDEDEGAVYLAIFNFNSNERKDMTINFERIGLEAGKEYKLYDLWSKETVEAKDELTIRLDRAEPKLYKIDVR